MSSPCLKALAATVLIVAPDTSAAARFVVYGDTRDNPAVHAKVVSAIVAAKPEFALFTGDAVMHADAPAEWTEFSAIEAPIADAGLPVFAVRGNHDTSPLFAQRFPQRPPGTQGAENYYSFDAGGVHFLGLDTEGDDSAASPQYAFAKSDLEAHASRGPIVVFLHRALYSSGHHGADSRLVELYAPLFRQAHVTAVFQGHDHDYERSKPLDGVTYFVEGGGGAKQRPFAGPPPEWSAFRATSFGYLLVDTRPGSLEVRAYDEESTLLDQIVLPTLEPSPDAGPRAAPVAAPPALPPSEQSSAWAVVAIIFVVIALGGFAMALGRSRARPSGR